MPVKLIERLFVRLQSIYGHRFSSQFVSDSQVQAAKKEWGYALAGYDGEDISYALSEMFNHHKTFPPNIPEFIELCEMHYKTLPVIEKPKNPKADRSVGKAEMEKIRSIGYPVKFNK